MSDLVPVAPVDPRDQIKLLVAKDLCEKSHLFFSRYFFKVRQNQKFRVNWHHHLVADKVDAVIRGEIENLVISVSPGSSKTELIVVNLIARGLALNPWARFLHLSGSDMLTSLNSSTARDIVTSDEFQAFWPMRISDDAKSKKRWNVEVEGKIAGGVYATAIGGQVTGFRAGHMAPGFQGCLIIDDPIKPEDAFSRSKVDAANRKLLTTVKSRKANPATPIVVVMQRVAESDPVGFIESGNMGGNWDKVRIPAIVDDEYVKTLDPKYQAMIEAERGAREEVNGRFSYWQYKEPINELLKMERGEGVDLSGGRISRHVFASQYDQRPRAIGGNIIRGEYFVRYRDGVLPKIRWRKIYADTAQKTKERNDWSVFEEWALLEDNRIALLDLIRGRWEAPELQRRAVAFWAKAKGRPIEKFGSLRKLMVEDKSSGTGLIQTIKLPPYNIQVEPVERGKDKLTRVMDALPYIEAGQVLIPEEAPWASDFVAEVEAFTADDSHDFDDQVDCLADAIDDMLQSGNKIKTWEALGKGKPS